LAVVCQRPCEAKLAGRILLLLLGIVVGLVRAVALAGLLFLGLGLVPASGLALVLVLARGLVAAGLVLGFHCTLVRFFACGVAALRASIGDPDRAVLRVALLGQNVISQTILLEHGIEDDFEWLVLGAVGELDVPRDAALAVDSDGQARNLAFEILHDLA